MPLQANAVRVADNGGNRQNYNYNAAQLGMSAQEYNLLKYGYDMEAQAVDKQIAAERQNIAMSNAFAASEAEKNRLFQQSSADKEMAFNHDEAELARIFSRDEAEKERAWQTEMSNTAYQRAVKDLQAAGLNPMLAVAQGGAASGQGAVAESSQAYGSRAAGSAATGFKASAQKADFSGIAKQALAILSDKLDRNNSRINQQDYLKALITVANMNNETSRANTFVSGTFQMIGAAIQAAAKLGASALAG